MRTIVCASGLSLMSSAALAFHSVTVGSCQPGANMVATIQMAVDTVGTNGVVNVCPGVYPEQVTVTKSNIKIQGVAPAGGNMSAAVVAVPSGGLVANTAYLGSAFPIAAQIAVLGATNVTITNLVVDASPPAGATSNGVNDCATDVVGVYFQNSQGTIQNSAFNNQALFPQAGLGGCQTGEGVVIENSSTTPSAVTVKNNIVSGYQKDGILAFDDAVGQGLTPTISGNTVEGQGPTMLIAANGIELDYLNAGTVTGNLVSNNVYTGPTYGASGILPYDASNLTISGNRIVGSQYPIAPYGDSANGGSNTETVSGNVIAQPQAFDGIDFCYSSGNTVKNNVIDGPAQSGIHLDSSCGPASTNNTVSANTVDFACAGILEGTNSGGMITADNKLNNTTTQVLTGTDVCGAVPAAPHAAGTRRPAPRLLRR